jgi:hypothetical protein
MFRDNLIHAIQQAELRAGFSALMQATKVERSVMTDLSQVVIKTDSEY